MHNRATAISVPLGYSTSDTRKSKHSSATNTATPNSRRFDSMVPELDAVLNGPRPPLLSGLLQSDSEGVWGGVFQRSSESG